MPTMTPDEIKARRARWLRYAAIAGFVLGLACQSLPPKYQTACSAVLDVFSLTCGVR